MSDTEVFSDLSIFVDIQLGFGDSLWTASQSRSRMLKTFRDLLSNVVVACHILRLLSSVTVLVHMWSHTFGAKCYPITIHEVEFIDDVFSFRIGHDIGKSHVEERENQLEADVAGL